jgi:hypothetical protein
VLRKCCQGRRGAIIRLSRGGARGTTGAHAVSCSLRDGGRAAAGRQQAAPSLLYVAWGRPALLRHGAGEWVLRWAGWWSLP